MATKQELEQQVVKLQNELSELKYELENLRLKGDMKDSLGVASKDCAFWNGERYDALMLRKCKDFYIDVYLKRYVNEDDLIILVKKTQD
jgi:hypothetical protein